MWRPYLLKDINSLERVQRHATKIILSDYTSDYKTRLKQLSILPLTYTYEIADIMFFVNSIKNPSPRFKILNHVDFLLALTRSAGSKLYHKTASTNSTINSYFYHLPKLWNRLPSPCQLFADDCILYRQINSPTDAAILQNDLKELENWDKVWKMKFNIEKCMVLTVTLKTSITDSLNVISQPKHPWCKKSCGQEFKKRLC